MTALGSQTIASSYEQLLHVDRDGGGDTANHVSVKDGDNETTFGFTIASDALMMSSTNRLEFGDTGTYIHQSADGVLDLVSDTELELTAPTVDINASTAITVDGPAVTIADGTGSKPLIIVKNTANDTTGSELRFVMDKGSAGADGDDLGTISFYGDDAGQNQTAFAKIVAEVSEADETDEAGKLSFYVAESDGTDTALTAGLILEGEHATDGEVDVTIGAGAGSTTTIAGEVSIPATKKLYLDGGGNTYIHESSGDTIQFVAGGTTAMSIADSSYWGSTSVFTDGGNATGLSFDQADCQISHFQARTTATLADNATLVLADVNIANGILYIMNGQNNDGTAAIVILKGTAGSTSLAVSAENSTVTKDSDGNMNVYRDEGNSNKVTLQNMEGGNRTYRYLYQGN